MSGSYAYHVGDLVNARTVGGPRPAIITNIQGSDITIRYTAKARGLALVKQADLTPNNEFDWCGGIALDTLQEGSAVEGRYLHGEGGKQWFQGKIAAINRNGTFAISYHDGDYEGSVRRENIRTKADKERPNPQLADFKRRRVKQSFASSLSPAHGGSASPGPKTGGGTGAGGKRKREVVAEGGSVDAEAPKRKRVQTVAAEAAAARVEETATAAEGAARRSRWASLPASM